MSDGILMCGDCITALFADEVLKKIESTQKNIKIVSLCSVSTASFLLRDKKELFYLLRNNWSQTEIEDCIQKNIIEGEIPQKIEICGSDIKHQSPVIFKKEFPKEQIRKFGIDDIVLSQVYFPFFKKPYRACENTFGDSTIIPYAPFFPISRVGAKNSIVVTFLDERPTSPYTVAINNLAKMNAKKAKLHINIKMPEIYDYEGFKNAVLSQVNI